MRLSFRPTSGQIVLWSLLVCAALLLFWSPLLSTPFWQDDFMFLYFAREAQELSEPWYSAFFPRQASIFWRPLSEGVYWRLIENRLNADPTTAHMMGLGVLVASALAVGWLAATLTRLVAPEANATLGGLLGAFLYGIHGAHFIPAAWATAVHTPTAILFSALALRFWIAALRSSGGTSGPGLLLVPLFFLLALFSKESALLTAGLGLLVTYWVWPRYKPTSSGWAIMGLCAVLAIVWLLARDRVTVPAIGDYEMAFGANVARNGTSLLLFLFNVPREALRFVLAEKSVAAGIWGAACFALQALAFWLLMRRDSSGLTTKGWTILALFFLVACTPYFLLSWNSYAYYITLGLIVWPIAAALSSAGLKTKISAVAAALLSSGLALAGNMALDYPALLARAKWAETQIPIIEEALPVPPQRLFVAAENPHKFQGIGPYGLAYVLAMNRKNIIELGAGESPPPGSTLLVIPAQGDVRVLLP
jgi:hypothetical protein